MADTPIDEHTFTDEEVREILKKAVEGRPSRAVVKRDGFSLSELKAIGEEVGIDPARLEDAARAVVVGGGNAPNRILGGPVVINFERKVPGEIDPDDTPEILTTVRRIMGKRGEIDEVHGTLEWRTSGEAGERYVTLSSRDGVTTIIGSSNLSDVATLTYLPGGMVGLIMAVVGVARFAKTGTEVGLIVALTAIPILYGILRTVYSRYSTSESDKLQRVVDGLVSFAVVPDEPESGEPPTTP